MKKHFLKILFVFVLIFGTFYSADAATLKVSPNTGVYTVGKPFTVSVLINTDGASVNAADGDITFNPKELQVVSVSRGSSIFNLWTEEPSFSNTAGTISFGGGSPSGYKGSGGTVMSITFKPLGAGTPKIQFRGGSILAADGLGTNILTSMNGGAYTVAATTESPAAEYIPPANTPKAPVVTSVTHPDQNSWYTEKTVKLRFDAPGDVVAVRMSLDDIAQSVPTNVYESPVSSKEISNLDEGTSYFHIQFKNKEGWGKIAHYRINVDTEIPQNLTIVEKPDRAPAGQHAFEFSLKDTSPIREYKIQIDGGEQLVWKDADATKLFTHPILLPGEHTIVVQAFDSAGNSSTATYSFTVTAFEKPVFTDYPERIQANIIPVLKGTTRPNATVSILIDSEVGDVATETLETRSDAQGIFVVVPTRKFSVGVYNIRARAVDESGMQSELSDPIVMIVDEPGYVTFGNALIRILSILVPLVALVLLLGFGTWYMWHRFSLWRRKLRKETQEVEQVLKTEFAHIIQIIDTRVTALKQEKKGKSSRDELQLYTEIEEEIKRARVHLSKELEDIEKIIR